LLGSAVLTMLWKRELRPTWMLALPIIAGNLSQMLMGVVDTLMIGRVGTVDLGAAALANALVHFILVIGMGITVAVSVQVAQAHGRKDGAGAGEALRHGTFLSLVCGVVLALILVNGMPVYRLLGQPAAVLEAMPAYLNWLAWSLVPALAGMCFKNFAEAKASPWPALWITLGGVVLNVFLNWVLIFGNLGSPALGLAGAGVATFIARTATMVILVVYVLRESLFAADRPARWLAPLRRSEIGLILIIGVPLGLQMLIEIGAFGISTVLIGTFGAVPLAAHQIAINLAAMAFMVPLGLSTAVTIRVGHAIGERAPQRGRGIATGALLSAVAFMSGTALLFLFAGQHLAAAFTPDMAVVALAAQLLVIAGIFQLGDGIQIVGMGVLRGLKDVRTPTVFLALIYWFFALPLGALLAYKGGLGAVGVWMGLAIGLGIAAAVLTWRAYFRLRQVERQQAALAAAGG
jgi:multidrug resistance protein, MATE family